ncbi:MAG: bifunctional aldolase/short-chain dehydrogenase [Myxococcota bacterium]
MQSEWSDAEAQHFVERCADVGREVALRVYTSRLIGREPDLVLHGGGNTSLKGRGRDACGHEIDVIYVKGSGWNLASIEPAGLPALDLAALRRLRELEALDDETMVAELRRALLDPVKAPNPSVETLLHAFLPQRFVDHSHADAILVLTNQPDGAARIRAVFGDRVAFVPYVMPGFELAVRAAEALEKAPEVDGLVLEKHGLFSFGEDARTSYERHVALVDRAERAVEGEIEGRRPLDARPVVAMRSAGEVAPLVRGALAEPTGDPDRPWRRWILEHRSSGEIAHFAASEQAEALCAAPPITPDHVIRTKGRYLWLARPPYNDEEDLAEALRASVAAYRSDYREYFERNQRRTGRALQMLDPTPRVVVLPGVGLFALGETRRAARIAADIAEHSIRAWTRAAMIGHYQGIREAELFDMEYWSLEQAKLARGGPRPPLSGCVALVTGGAGAIGEGIARRLLHSGATVTLVDRDGERLAGTRERLADERCETFECDVSDAIELARAFEQSAALFGGVDLVVANAGIAEAGRLEDLEPERFERALQGNTTGTFLTLREALRQLRRQGTGGDIVLISTKNVFAPGAGFGAYSASKAGAHQLARIAALEGAEIDVRVNAINADAVFGGPDNRSGLWEQVGPERARARGLTVEELEEFYRRRNLLRARVTPEHVGDAVVFLAGRSTPTTGAVLPVDGGLPEAFPR